VHGTGLDGQGLPVVPTETVTPAMWLTAARTLSRLAGLGERAGRVFTLENLNTAVDHPGTPFARAAGVPRRCRVDRERLVADDRQAPVDRLADEGHVGVQRCRHHDGVDVVRRQLGEAAVHAQPRVVAVHVGTPFRGPDDDGGEFAAGGGLDRRAVEVAAALALADEPDPYLGPRHAAAPVARKRSSSSTAGRRRRSQVSPTSAGLSRSSGSRG
jgi:hypothetical protein